MEEEEEDGEETAWQLGIEPVEMDEEEEVGGWETVGLTGQKEEEDGGWEMAGLTGQDEEEEEEALWVVGLMMQVEEEEALWVVGLMMQAEEEEEGRDLVGLMVLVEA